MHDPDAPTSRAPALARRRIGVVAKGSATQLPLLREAAAGLGPECDVAVRTTGPDEDVPAVAAELARAADVVVAAGGDGTINAVVRGLLRRPRAKRPALGVVPLGTANDFARTAGVPIIDLAAALRHAATAPAVPVDIGLADGEPFVNVASLGVGAEIVRRTPQQLKDALGGAAYTLFGLASLFDVGTAPLTLRGPGLEWSGQAFIVAVGNARTAGGGYRVTDRAVLDDGLLDVLVIHEAALRDVPALVARLTALDADVSYDEVLYAQVPRLEVLAPEGIALNVDGEPRRIERAVFRAASDEIRLVAGPTAPLRANQDRS